MTFQPFQLLYQQVRKYDPKLFTAMDLIDGYLQDLYSQIGSLVGFKSPLITKGDLFGYDTQADRIPVGTDGQVLTADSAVPLGVQWMSPLIAYAGLNSLGLTATLAMTNIRHLGVVLPLGSYLVVLNQASSSTGSTTLSGALTYVDPKAGAQVVPFGGTTSTGLELQTLTLPICTDGVHDLTAAVTKTGAGTVSYNLNINLIRLN